MVYANPTVSIITLNMDGLKTSITRQRSSEWIKRNACVVYRRLNFTELYGHHLFSLEPQTQMELPGGTYDSKFTSFGRSLLP